jgi:hypothetical protein
MPPGVSEVRVCWDLARLGEGEDGKGGSTGQGRKELPTLASGLIL